MDTEFQIIESNRQHLDAYKNVCKQLTNLLVKLKSRQLAFFGEFVHWPGVAARPTVGDTQGHGKMFPDAWHSTCNFGYHVSI